ncbi:MAG: DUF2806 domain-containing protein [Candidatus Yonathbacteria bacterium]|nr:DUF2806 domain-containing protein [Candidatus Yonathbacteria bacterium]
MDPLITKELVELGSQTASKPVASFSELIALKFFGKSIAKLKAEAEVEGDKVLSRWEEVEKPIWLQAEAVKMNRQYENFGNTLKKASKYITEENTILNDNDLFWGLLEHSKEITNEDVQELIAKIIAGEYNVPGSYSMSTLQILKSLGKKDLEKFSFFASFYLPRHGFFKDFFNMREKSLSVRTKLGINYADFLELQNLGLVQNGDYTVSVTVKKDGLFSLDYYGDQILFKATKDFDKWNFPVCYELTKAGKEILKHLKINKSPDFKDWLIEDFKTKGFEPQN